MAGPFSATPLAVGETTLRYSLHGAIECQFLLGCQLADGAFREVAQRKRADRYANQSQNFNTQSLQHAPDVPILSFIENNLHPRIAFPLTEKGSALHAKRVSFFRTNPILQSFQQRRVRDFPNLHVIGLVQMRFRRRHASTPLGIVREQQQALACPVQPPDRRHPRKLGPKKRVHGLAPFFIRSRSYNPARFIHREIDFRCGVKSVPVDFDTVPAKPNRRLRIAPDRSIHAHFSTANQLRRLHSGTET